MRGLIYRWLAALRRPFTIVLELMFFGVVCLMYITFDEISEQVFLDLDSGLPLFLFGICSTAILLLQLANDRTDGIERYFLSAPVSRRKYLLTAYLFYGGACFLISLIYVGTFMISVYSKGGSIDAESIVKGYFTISCALFLLSTLLILSILCMSRAGSIIMFVCIWGCFTLFSIIANSDPGNNPIPDIISGICDFFAQTNAALLVPAIIAASAALSALIAFISVKLYRRRDIK